MWALFATYQGILGRVIFVTAGTKANSDRRWYRDDKTLQLILSAFGPALLAELQALPFQRLSWLQIKLDRELMDAFDGLLIGKEYSAAALNRAMEMEHMVASLKADQEKSNHHLTL